MIKFMQLITGDEVVSTIEDKGDSILLKWPAKLVTMETEEGPKPSVAAFLPHVKGHAVIIHKSKILYIAEPVAPLKEYYDKNFGSMVPPDDLQDSTAYQLSEAQVTELETN